MILGSRFGMTEIRNVAFFGKIFLVFRIVSDILRIYREFPEFFGWSITVEAKIFYRDNPPNN